MKYLCDACSRLIEPSAVNVESGTVRLTCAVCGGETAAQAGTPERTEPPVKSEPAVQAPSSEDGGDPARRETAKPPALYLPEAACLASGTALGHDPAAMSLLRAVLRNYGNEAVHHALLDHCLRKAALGDLARIYKKLAEVAGEAVSVEKHLARITTVAQSAILIHEEKKEDTEKTRNIMRWSVLGIIMLVVFVLGGLICSKAVEVGGQMSRGTVDVRSADDKAGPPVVR